MRTFAAHPYPKFRGVPPPPPPLRSGIKFSLTFFLAQLTKQAREHVRNDITYVITLNIFCRYRFRLHFDLGPIRTCGQILNVMTFLTKTKLSRQVRDILKKTKGVIISTIALHVLLATLYISRHGRLVQTSNNQAGPRGEKF